jgi:hypothetical protein
MRALILAAGAALTLAACGGGETANSDANAMATDNLSMDANMTMDANAMDANAMNMGGMDANMATNMSAEGNMMANDMNTNAPDTNLANGM